MSASKCFQYVSFVQREEMAEGGSSMLFVSGKKRFFLFVLVLVERVEVLRLLFCGCVYV